MSTPTIFEVIIIFHYLSVFNNKLQRKVLTVLQTYRAGRWKSFSVQRVLKAGRSLLASHPFRNFRNQWLITWCSITDPVSFNSLQRVLTIGHCSNSVRRFWTLVVRSRIRKLWKLQLSMIQRTRRMSYASWHISRLTAYIHFFQLQALRRRRGVVWDVTVCFGAQLAFLSVPKSFGLRGSRVQGYVTTTFWIDHRSLGRELDVRESSTSTSSYFSSCASQLRYPAFWCKVAGLRDADTENTAENIPIISRVSNDARCCA